MDAFALNAILERLTGEGETFDAGDARRLIAGVPAASAGRFGLEYQRTSRGPRVNGHAAGIGDIEIPGRSETRRYALGGDREHRIGGYVVTHVPGAITIALMWADTHEDQTGRKCLLLYDEATGKPDVLKISVHRRWSLFGHPVFGLTTFAPWKRPLDRDGSEPRGEKVRRP